MNPASALLGSITYWWWRPYLTLGRGQLRIGCWRRRQDRIEPEYRWISIGVNT